MFCPKCGSLMFPSDGRLACGNSGCGYSKGIGKGEIANSRVAVRMKRDRPPETLVLDDILDTLPKTHVECPKCAHFEAFWVMRQTRAADEPTTRIYRCVKCSHTWREY